MRASEGLVILALGIVALGLWGRADHAHRIEDQIAQSAAEVVAGSVHGASTMVSGRDIHLSGLIDGPEELQSLRAALEAVPGRRVVSEEVTVLEVVSPFDLQVDKSAEGTLSALGHIPTEALRGELSGALGASAAGLTLAAGAPGGWADLARAGIAGLGPMRSGQMSLSDGALMLRGEVLGPDEAAAVQAALSVLPAGAVQTDLTLLDDGTPAAYTLGYSAAESARLSGKLPPGLDLGAMGTAMGLPLIISDAKQGLLGAAGDAEIFAGLNGLMGQFEAMTLSVSPYGSAEGNSIDGAVTPGADQAALQTALASAMPGFKVSLTAAAISGENGARRVNAATGADQRLMGGYWLDVPQFAVTIPGCQAEVDAVLAGARIEFQSGSDVLDASAVAVVNRLGAYIARCVDEAGLKAEIGGHTDGQGDAAANLGLSQRRAVAVRKELIARGVAPNALKAQGYGDALPIADNATEEGRAQNRRTAVLWSE